MDIGSIQELTRNLDVHSLREAAQAPASQNHSVLRPGVELRTVFSNVPLLLTWKLNAIRKAACIDNMLLRGAPYLYEIHAA